MKPIRAWKLDDYIVYVGILICLVSLLIWNILESWSPKRTLVATDNMTLLWSDDIEIDYPIVFLNGDDVIVSTAKELLSFDLETGMVNWQTTTPTPVIIHKYEDRIYVTSDKRLPVAPTVDGQEFPSCSFGGFASLSAYDINTGELFWGYKYLGVEPKNLAFSEQVAYLSGSDNHGASQSISKIDVLDGSLTFHDCSWDVRNRSVPRAPVFHSDDEVYNPIDVNNGNFLWSTNNTISVLGGRAVFRGIRLDKYQIIHSIFNDKAFVYFQDSNQLYVFQMEAGSK